jgi:hypothetical protein
LREVLEAAKLAKLLESPILLINLNESHPRSADSPVIEEMILNFLTIRVAGDSALDKQERG